MQPILYTISLSFFSALKGGNLKNPVNLAQMDISLISQN